MFAFSENLRTKSAVSCRGFEKTVGPMYIGSVTTFCVLAAYLVMLHLLWTAIVDLHVKRIMNMRRATCLVSTNCLRFEQFCVVLYLAALAS